MSLLLEDFDFDFAGAFPRPKRPPVGFLVDLDFASFEDVVFTLVSFVLLSFAFASFAFASFALVSLFVLGAAAFASLVDVLEVAGLERRRQLPESATGERPLFQRSGLLRGFST